MSTQTNPDVDYEHVGFITASDYRTQVVDELTNQPATPSTVADRTGIDISHVSRALNKLRDMGLVDLLVDEDRRKGRIYGLTNTGEAAARGLDMIDGGDN